MNIVANHAFSNKKLIIQKLAKIKQMPLIYAALIKTKELFRIDQDIE